VPPIGRQPGGRGVPSEEMVNESSGERRAPELPAAEEIRAGIVSAHSQVPIEERQAAWEKLVGLRHPALQAADEDSAVSHRINREDGDLPSTEPVKVHEAEQADPGRLPLNRAEETRDFILRQVLHSPLS
jgi:hypothetical protein